jgi:hypothetical protein
MRKTAFELYRVDIQDVKRSQSWFDEKIAGMNRNRITPNSIMLKDGVDKLTSSLVPSKLYSFYYWPEGAEELPHFDTFPLVFPFAKTDKTFTGLNMHYLDYPMRFALFKQLLKISNATNITEASKMNINWQNIRGISKLAPAQACVKQYLFSQVKSPFLEISPVDWTTAMLLPTARFRKQTTEQVWSQTKKVRGW